VEDSLDPVEIGDGALESGIHLQYPHRRSVDPHHGDQQAEERLPVERAVGHVASAHDEHHYQPHARHRLEEEAREALRLHLAHEVAEEIGAHTPGRVQYGTLAAVHLDDANTVGHLQEAVVQMADTAPALLRRALDPLPDPERRNRTERNRDQPDDGQLGAHQPRDGDETEEPRDVEDHVADRQRSHPHVLHVAVGGHHQVALAVLVVESGGEGEELGEELPHRGHLDAVREPARQRLGHERGACPGHPDAEDQESADHYCTRRLAPGLLEGEQHLAQSPDEQPLEESLQQRRGEEGTPEERALLEDAESESGGRGRRLVALSLHKLT
jgi:hypothetical protein